jgi:hypothetical protein
MVETGAAMKENERRPFPHRGTIGYKPRALDIEKQAHAVHEHMHDDLLALESSGSWSLLEWLRASPSAAAACQETPDSNCQLPLTRFVALL